MKLFELPRTILADLKALARSLNLPAYDLLLVGDGSGTCVGLPAGWGCIAYDRRERKVVLHTGAVSSGTNNLAELFPYVQALWHHSQGRQQQRASPVRAQIVSDSVITVNCGNGLYQRKANGALWASIDWFAQNGYSLSWHHVPRNSSPCSALMDSVAGKARKLLLEQQAGLLEAERTAEVA